METTSLYFAFVFAPIAKQKHFYDFLKKKGVNEEKSRDLPYNIGRMKER